jgi:hypothetical protein
VPVVEEAHGEGLGFERVAGYLIEKKGGFDRGLGGVDQMDQFAVS